MTDIERSGTLNPELIDGEHYFSSFLSEAVAHGLIDIPEFQKIQLQLIELLAEKNARIHGRQKLLCQNGTRGSNHEFPSLHARSCLKKLSVIL